MVWLASILAALWLGAGAAAAGCHGTDILQSMPAAERDALVAAAHAAPYPSGNLWRASRGDATVTLVGTLHINDPRHEAKMRRVQPLVAGADLVLVEATGDEMASLAQVMADDPGLAFTLDGPPLRELLDEADWHAFRREMAARGVPAFLSGRMQPWLAFVTLSAPACLLTQGPEALNGLDARIETAAAMAGVPVQGIEDFTILFEVFGSLTRTEALDILRATLLAAPHAEDILATLTAAYFAGEHRLVWEFSRAWLPPGLDGRIDVPAMQEIFARLEEVLLVRRNRAWMEILLPLTEAQSDIVLAVGAAHLSGHGGMLDLLDRAGFVLNRLPD